MYKNSKKKKIMAAAVLMGLLALGGGSASAAVTAQTLAEASHMKQSKISELQDDSRVFSFDSSIETKQVSFQNRYGFDVAGHLYLPHDFDRQGSYKAVVVSGPFGAVKEQASGLYAQELAKNGFVALAFDQSMTGESSGVRRNMGSPDIFTEDYSAAVDFLSQLDFVNPEQIGAAGICGLSGMAITAAANDIRIKAVVTGLCTICLKASATIIREHIIRRSKEKRLKNILPGCVMKKRAGAVKSAARMKLLLMRTGRYRHIQPCFQISCRTMQMR